MRFHALACDYDGTIATHGRVDEETQASLKRVRKSGRKLFLVTGRVMEELLEVFPELDMFERVVAENGALIYNPSTKEETVLGEPPDAEFMDTLRKKGVTPLVSGKVIIATHQPYETAVLEAIRDQELELQVIFNKGAVMILPSGINKAVGLKAALQELKLSPHNVVGVGDAENDHAFLGMCECSAVVANALPKLKEHADFVSRKTHGAGVSELVEKLLGSDLSELDSRFHRHHIPIGTNANGQGVNIKPYGVNVMLSGTSGSGKSTFVTAFMERLAAMKYQFCVFDPEGDYQSLDKAIVLGDAHQAPTIEEVTKLLEDSHRNVVVNLLGTSFDYRPQFFLNLLPVLLEMRSRWGRPHWIIVDETHHFLPASLASSLLPFPKELRGMFFITVHPDHVNRDVLASIDSIIGVGDGAEKTIRIFSEALGQDPPPFPTRESRHGESLSWWRHESDGPFWFQSFKPKAERRRHLRKYSQGELGADECFYFRGPENKMKLKAQNLMVFMQMAEGVDDETWLFHLRKGDISQWFRTAIKDESLAGEAERIEKAAHLSAQESRSLVKEKIQEIYTAPA